MNDDKQNYWQPNPDEEQPAPEVASQPESSPEPPVELPIAAEEPELDDTQPTEPADTTPDVPVTWTAQEYIHPDKSKWWYVIFWAVVVILIVLDVVFLKIWSFSVLIVVMAVALVVYIRRPPRDLTYTLSKKQGLSVGEKLYHLEDFKAFGLIRDGEHYSIMLIPRKRFAPGVSVYFPESAGEQIVDILGQRLPMQELKLDVIDVVVRKLRL